MQEDRKRHALEQANFGRPPAPTRQGSAPHSAGFVPRSSIAAPPMAYGAPPPGSRPLRTHTAGQLPDFGRAPFSAPVGLPPFPMSGGPHPLMRTPTGTPPPIYPRDTRASQMWYPPYPFTPSSAAGPPSRSPSSASMIMPNDTRPQQLGYFPVHMQLPPSPASVPPPASSTAGTESDANTVASPNTPRTEASRQP